MTTPVVAILSMLHEGATVHSANRTFAGAPVLARTLRRLSDVAGVHRTFILCWDDQSPAVASAVAGIAGCSIACKGKRHPIAHVDAVTAAARWSDGWRGGLLQTCDFDHGFHAAWTKELAGDAHVLLVDPAAGLLDPDLVAGLVDHASTRPELDLFFTQAAPGLCGTLVRAELLARLATRTQHPGKLLHYQPDHPSRDPISAECCFPVPTSLARTTHNFKLNSNRQVQRLTAAFAASAVGCTPRDASQARHDDDLDLQDHADSQQLLEALNGTPDLFPVPREIVLELTTRRSTFPAFGPAKHFAISRPDLSVDVASILFDQLSAADDVRLTLAGVGDPLCHPGFFDIVERARAAGIQAIHVETDLHDLNAAQVAGLVEAGIDVVAVNLPAATAQTYHKLMGVDALTTVLNNIKQFVVRRQVLDRAAPILVPTFVKCRDNFHEMETWYDQWLRAVGSAVITGPSDCARQIPSLAIADMTPPKRKACVRLARRMTVLSDGRIVSCEQDVFGRRVMGEVGRETVADVWQKSFGSLRDDHSTGDWDRHPLCAACSDWYRP